MSASVASDPVTPRQELVLLEPKDRAQLDAERSALMAEIERELPSEIASPAEYSAIAALEERLGRFITRAEPLFDEHCSAAHRVWKSACQIRALFLDAPKALKERARALLGNYVQQEERLRRQEEARIAQEEQQREIDRRKVEAKLLDKQGQKELAAAVRAEPVYAPAVALPSAVPQTQGLTYREDWFWEPIGGDTPANRMRSLGMLVPEKHVAFVKLDDAGLTAFAKRTKGTIRVPGIVFRMKKTPVRR